MHSGVDDRKFNAVRLTGINRDTLEQIVHYMYTCQVTITSSSVLPLHAAAKCLQLSHLQNLCKKFTSEHFDEPHVSLIYTQDEEITEQQTSDDYPHILKSLSDEHKMVQLPAPEISQSSLVLTEHCANVSLDVKHMEGDSCNDAGGSISTDGTSPNVLYQDDPKTLSHDISGAEVKVNMSTPVSNGVLTYYNVGNISL